MEADASQEGFQIPRAKIPIRLALRSINELQPHEETVPSDLERLVALLRREPLLRHPLMADGSTGLVLDGTHRLAALTKLGCLLAPCANVNYQDKRIMVDKWFRQIEGETLENFDQRLAAMHPQRQENSRRAEECLSTRTCYAVLENHHFSMTFPTRETDSIVLARACFEIEKIARNGGLRITYEDLKSIPSFNGFLLSTIGLTKKEILRASSQHRVYPPKTTRHVIPSRPLGVGVPLEWLKADDRKEAQQKFLKHLESKRLTRKPEGSWVGSRRYQEETFVFE